MEEIENPEKSGHEEESVRGTPQAIKDNDRDADILSGSALPLLLQTGSGPIRGSDSVFAG